MRYSTTTAVAATAAASEVFNLMSREERAYLDPVVARDQLSAALDRRPDHFQVGLALRFLEAIIAADQ